MSIAGRLAPPFFATEKKKERLRFDLPIAQRLMLGFLVAALIAGLVAGGTTLFRIRSLHQASDFYQQLLQAKTTLTTGKDLLEFMNSQLHQVLIVASTQISVETLTDDETQVYNLITLYDGLLRGYAAHSLLKDHPDQVALLNEANDGTRVTRQIGLVSSALRTWHFFQKTQLQILNSINPHTVKPQNVTNALNLERLQGEPLSADAESAMTALVRFNEDTSSAVSNAVTVEEANQWFTTSIGILLAIISIVLIGLFISSAVVQRLKQIRRVTSAVEEGAVKDRIRVVGRDEIADISMAINKMLEIIVAGEETTAALELKDQFIASVSHELRNPLTNVFGWLEILSEHNRDLDEETRTRFLHNAMHGCQELMYLTDNVLESTRVEHKVQEPQIEEIAVNRVVQTVIDQLDPRQIEAYDLHIDVGEELFVQADQHYVRQILRNLLSNALKYSPKQSAISINATCDELNGVVCISVKDNGPGILPQELPKLFQKFSRLQHDRYKKVNGTGLGLYICKQLVEIMHGRIWAESAGIAGKGSRFSFTLPASTRTVDASQSQDSYNREVMV